MRFKDFRKFLLFLFKVDLHIESRFLLILNFDESISKFRVKLFLFIDIFILKQEFTLNYLITTLNIISQVRFQIWLLLHPNLLRAVTSQAVRKLKP